MSKIATIKLMRKGSKRFPGKNVAMFRGHPLYMHTVQTAALLGHPYYLIHDYNPLPMPLPMLHNIHEVKEKAEHAGDDHKTAEAILDAGIDADTYILLQVTSPVRDIGMIRAAVAFLEAWPTFKAVFAVKKLKDGYYYDGTAESMNHDKELRGYNAYPKPLEAFRETGNFYVFRACQLKEPHILHCAASERYMMADPYGLDIDTSEDLKGAEPWSM